MPLPLYLLGAVEVLATLPTDPALSGSRFALQAVLQGPGPLLSGMTNAYFLDIE